MKTTQTIAIVKAIMGMTTIPQAKKIFRVCAFHGFFAQDLVDATVLSTVMYDCASISSMDLSVDACVFFGEIGARVPVSAISARVSILDMSLVNRVTVNP